MPRQDAFSSGPSAGDSSPSRVDHLNFSAPRLRTRVYLADPALVAVEGHVDGESVPALRRALDLAIGAGHRDVDLDLSGTQSISVAGLRQVRLARSQLAAAGRRLRVLSASKKMQELLIGVLSSSPRDPSMQESAGPDELSMAGRSPGNVPARVLASVDPPVDSEQPAPADRVRAIHAKLVHTPELITGQAAKDGGTNLVARHRGARNLTAQSGQSAFHPPSTGLAAFEQRSILEFWLFLASYPILGALARGDGHPVMVLPPFAVDDSYTSPLRAVLHAQGYSVHGWRQGTNLSRTRRIVAGLPQRLLDLHARHGTKVSLVGHSGGGTWARDLAREYPYAVRQVITLGSPFRLRPGDVTHADGLADALLVDQVPKEPAALLDEDLRPPVPVPVTSIYTRTDGVATWYAGLESAGPYRENIEVFGSHCGLAHNPAAVIAVADRLAQPAGGWRPFEPPALIRHLYPRPTYWQRPSAAAS